MSNRDPGTPTAQPRTDRLDRGLEHAQGFASLPDRIESSDEEDRRRDQRVVGEEDGLVLGDEHDQRQGGRHVQDNAGIGRPGQPDVVESDVHGAGRAVHDERDLQVVLTRSRDLWIDGDSSGRRPTRRAGIREGRHGHAWIEDGRAVHGNEEPARREAARDSQVEADGPGVRPGAAHVEGLPEIAAGTGPEQGHLDEPAGIPAAPLVGGARRGAP